MFCPLQKSLVGMIWKFVEKPIEKQRFILQIKYTSYHVYTRKTNR